MRLVRYATNQGRIVALVTEARKWLYTIPMDARGIRIVKVRKHEERYMTDIDYPIGKAKRRFRRAGKAFGITKSARQLLR